MHIAYVEIFLFSVWGPPLTAEELTRGADLLHANVSKQTRAEDIDIDIDMDIDMASDESCPSEYFLIGAAALYCMYSRH
jgi:hypothetical protein